MSAKPISRGEGRVSLTVHPDDNVATILDSELECGRLADGSPVAPGIPFGHKVALKPILKGEPVVKYGIVIGTALTDISAGEHVHVHNLA